MRRLSRPASAKVRGSTLRASMPLPVGASWSSQRRPRTIRPSRLATATRCDQATAGERACCIAGYHASNESSLSPAGSPRGELARAHRAAARDAAALALAGDAAPAFPRRPSGPDREQPELHDTDLAGAAGHGDAGDLLGLPDVRLVPGVAAEVLPAEPGARQHRQA